jgi:hypothetical protein
MLHALKTVQPYFKYIQDGIKNFEVRKGDRPFGEGDEILLQEWDDEKKQYTGQEWKGVITMIMRDEKYCKKGFVIMSIKPKENDY